MKTNFRVEAKPVRKYKPLFTADSLEEIESWLNTNCKWVFSGTNGAFQKRVTTGGYEVAITTPTKRADMMDDNDNIPSVYSEAAESYSLCHRRTPERI